MSLVDFCSIGLLRNSPMVCASDTHTANLPHSSGFRFLLSLSHFSHSPNRNNFLLPRITSQINYLLTLPSLMQQAQASTQCLLTEVMKEAPKCKCGQPLYSGCGKNGDFPEGGHKDQTAPQGLGLFQNGSKLHHLYMLHLILISYLMAKYDRGTSAVHAGLQSRTKSAGRYVSVDGTAMARKANWMLFRQFSKTLLRPSLSTLSQNIVNMKHRWGSLLKIRQPGDGSLFMASTIIFLFCFV